VQGRGKENAEMVVWANPKENWNEKTVTETSDPRNRTLRVKGIRLNTNPEKKERTS